MRTVLECKEYRVIVEDMDGNNQWDISTAGLIPGIGEQLILPGSNGETVHRVVRMLYHSWEGTVQFVRITVWKH